MIALPPEVQAALERRKRLDKVQDVVRAKCPPDVGALVNVSNVENRRLIITVPSSAIAMKMRWLMSKLHDSLKVEIPGYDGKIDGIDLKVRDPNAGDGLIPEPPSDTPAPAKKEPPAHQRKIHEAKAAEAYEIAAAMEDSPIKAKLLRLLVNIAPE